jgi:hypothetical protein
MAWVSVREAQLVYGHQRATAVEQTAVLVLLNSSHD